MQDHEASPLVDRIADDGRVGDAGKDLRVRPDDVIVEQVQQMRRALTTGRRNDQAHGRVGERCHQVGRPLLPWTREVAPGRAHTGGDLHGVAMFLEVARQPIEFVFVDG
jgi:hypothetical protein